MRLYAAVLLPNEHSNSLSYQTYPRSILHRISPLKITRGDRLPLQTNKKVAFTWPSLFQKGNAEMYVNNQIPVLPRF